MKVWIVALDAGMGMELGGVYATAERALADNPIERLASKLFKDDDNKWKTELDDDGETVYYVGDPIFSRIRIFSVAVIE